MAGREYTVAECKEKLDAINERIERYQDMPQVMRKGSQSANFITRLKDLEADREYWERKLSEAKARDAGNNTLQGPDINLR